MAEREAILPNSPTRCICTIIYRRWQVRTMQYTIQIKFAPSAAKGELEPTITAAARSHSNCRPQLCARRRALRDCQALRLRTLGRGLV